MILISQALKDYLPALRNLDAASITRLVEHMRVGRVPAGEILVRGGEEGDALHVILEGVVEALDPEGKVVDLYSAGEAFGRITAISGIRTEFTARSRTALQVATLTESRPSGSSKATRTWPTRSGNTSWPASDRPIRGAIMTWTCGFALLFACVPALADPAATLPGTRPLTEDGDLSKTMLDGLHRFAERKIDESVADAGEALEPRPLLPGGLREVGPGQPRVVPEDHRRRRPAPARRRWSGSATTTARPWWPRTTPSGSTRCAGRSWRASTARACCWSRRARCGATSSPCPTRTRRRSRSRASPPASRPDRSSPGGWRRTASASWSRPSSAAASTFSGNPRIAMTNQPHREWIYRQAYQMGRHVIGYEVQKVLAAVDWIKAQAGPGSKVGVAGYGEGGLIAFYAAAADPRIDAALVSGYFGPRQRVWAEPIYRNVWGLLREFGDAEIATLIAPRGLVVEYSEGPRVDGPPAVPKGRRGGAAVGELGTPAPDDVLGEWKRLDALLPAGFQERVLVHGDGGAGARLRRPGGRAGLRRAARRRARRWSCPRQPPTDRRKGFDPDERQRRQVKELEDHVQRLLRGADATRDAFFLDQHDADPHPGAARRAVPHVPRQGAVGRGLRPGGRAVPQDARRGGDRPHRRPGAAGRPALAHRSTTRRSGPATR